MDLTLEQRKTVTLKLPSKDYKWSDGQQLNNHDDYIFTYEFIGRKDYDGVRYEKNAENIWYGRPNSAGKADKISGTSKSG